MQVPGSYRILSVTCYLPLPPDRTAIEWLCNIFFVPVPPPFPTLSSFVSSIFMDTFGASGNLNRLCLICFFHFDLDYDDAVKLGVDNAASTAENASSGCQPTIYWTKPTHHPCFCPSCNASSYLFCSRTAAFRLAALTLISRQQEYQSWYTLIRVNKHRLRSKGAKEIGAIGVGHKKYSPSGQFDDSPLRTLNINTLDPFGQKTPALNLSFEAAAPGSPDFSSASVFFALLTLIDLSLTIPFDIKQLQSPYELVTGPHSDRCIPRTSLPFEPSSPMRLHHISDNGVLSHSPTFSSSQMPTTSIPYLSVADNIIPRPSYSIYPASLSDQILSQLISSPQPPMSHHCVLANNVGTSHGHISSGDLYRRHLFSLCRSISPHTELSRSIPPVFVRRFYTQSSPSWPQGQSSHEAINFLLLRHSSSTPPYHSLVSRIIKGSDQQASIFLAADLNEHVKIGHNLCSKL
ncbi:hypothetical protein EDD85DRAFT_956485 [Armillaria nabsnona]|nr:hypothetical protein EDD85DRAFT_956485 [Armillaria nabsnona]